MALRIGEKPLTNAEKQKRFRQRKKATGLVRRDTWTDRAGFLARPSESGGYATAELKEVERQLEHLLSNFEEWEREVVYAEILEYVKQVIPKYRKVFAVQRMIEQEELKHGYR